MNPKALLQIDFLAGVSAIGWAVGAQYLVALENLASWEAAGVFGFVALTRWYLRMRKAK